MKLMLSILAFSLSLIVSANSDGMSCSGIGSDGSKLIFSASDFSLVSHSQSRYALEALNLRTVDAYYPTEGEVYTFSKLGDDQTIARVVLEKLLKESDVWEIGGGPCDGGLGFGPGTYGSTMLYQASLNIQNSAPVEFELVCTAAASYSADCRFDEWMHESF